MQLVYSITTAKKMDQSKSKKTEKKFILCHILHMVEGMSHIMAIECKTT